MKLLGIVIIMGCCAFVGHKISLKYQSRQNLFRALSLFAADYCANLNYAKKPLASLFDGEYGGEFSQTRLCLAEGKTPPYLTKEEYPYVRDFFSSLGKSDSASSLVQADFFTKYFNESHQKACEERKQKASLSLKLGVFVGLLFSILVL